ncbi:hypothetical protein OUZ56_029130 [Daphnia magna]|uniref:Uncharacterized protein n=1 Tax=Daphnia magna TaxID=35525 RepID=A0ABR0B5X1_9CRUS|nr:hypothetical protein OUZ56_029130 [Daphnia magna]
MVLSLAKGQNPIGFHYFQFTIVMVSKRILMEFRYKKITSESVTLADVNRTSCAITKSVSLLPPSRKRL